MKQIYIILINCATFVFSIRPGGQCDSKYGAGLCTPIGQCKLLNTVKQLGYMPLMCGFDSGGPIVCCPKYIPSSILKKPSNQNQREPSINGRPDPDFSSKMQGDQPSNDRYDSYNVNKGYESRPIYNENNNFWNNDEANLYESSTSSWANNNNNGKRKTPHEKFGDFSTNGYSNHYEENFKPSKKPTFQTNSYEENNYRPDYLKPSPYPSNFNNKPVTNNNWEDDISPVIKPTNDRPYGSFNENKNGFGSNLPSTTEDDVRQPVWGLVKDKTSTYRPPSTQNSWSKPSKRVSQMKCEEYSGVVTNNLRPLPLLPNPDEISIKVSRCGADAVPLIVGGTDAMPGEFPHMVALGFQSRGNINWNCGGTLISEEYVMTAAHCTHTNDGYPVKVRLGDWNIKRDDDAQSEDYRVARVIVHPSYSRSKKYNDIALLKLEQKVRFKETIRPACLFDSDRIPVNTTIATGWGRTETAGAKTAILQKVKLPVINNRECNDMYSDAKREASLNNGITNNMLCAGNLAGGFDTCLGDSGGPLQFSKSNNKCVFYVVGVTSFGKSMCGEKRSPGVYTRVSSYLPWIESVVWPNE